MTLHTIVDHETYAAINETSVYNLNQIVILQRKKLLELEIPFEKIKELTKLYNNAETETERETVRKKRDQAINEFFENLKTFYKETKQKVEEWLTKLSQGRVFCLHLPGWAELCHVLEMLDKIAEWLQAIKGYKNGTPDSSVSNGESQSPGCFGQLKDKIKKLKELYEKVADLMKYFAAWITGEIPKFPLLASDFTIHGGYAPDFTVNTNSSLGELFLLFQRFCAIIVILILRLSNTDYFHNMRFCPFVVHG